MAKKRDWLNFWCPIGVGILFCGAALNWPGLGPELIAIGAFIITASITHQRFELPPSLSAGLIVGVLAFGTVLFANRLRPLPPRVESVAGPSSNGAATQSSPPTETIVADCHNEALPLLLPANGAPIKAISILTARQKIIELGDTNIGGGMPNGRIEPDFWLHENGSIGAPLCEFSTVQLQPVFDVKVQMLFFIFDSINAPHKNGGFDSTKGGTIRISVCEAWLGLTHDRVQDCSQWMITVARP